MTHERDIERLLDVWFSDGPTQAPDRVIDAVTDRIDRQRQRPAWRLRSWRDIHMDSKLRMAAGAAAVIVIVVVALAVLRASESGVGGGPSPTPRPIASPSTIPSPTATGYTWPGPLKAGVYTTKFIWDIPFDVTLTVPDGWESRDIEVIKDPQDATEAGGRPDLVVSFTLVENVYADPCGHVAMDPPLGKSVDELADALSTLPGLDATGPTSISFDRSTTGKYLEFTVREDIGCDLLEFYLWDFPAGSVRRDRGPVGSLTLPAEQQRARIWILDVSGVRLVISALWSPQATSADLAELQEIIDSIHIARPGATPPPQPSTP